MTNIIWSAGENKAFGIFVCDSLQGFFRVDVFNRNANLSEASADEVSCLGTEVNNEKHILLYKDRFLPVKMKIRNRSGFDKRDIKFLD